MSKSTEVLDGVLGITDVVDNAMSTTTKEVVKKQVVVKTNDDDIDNDYKYQR